MGGMQGAAQRCQHFASDKKQEWLGERGRRERSAAWLSKTPALLIEVDVLAAELAAGGAGKALAASFRDSMAVHGEVRQCTRLWCKQDAKADGTCPWIGLYPQRRSRLARAALRMRECSGCEQ